VREISADKPKKEKELADVRKQIGDLQQQLAGQPEAESDLRTTVAQATIATRRSQQAGRAGQLVGATPERRPS